MWILLELIQLPILILQVAISNDVLLQFLLTESVKNEIKITFGISFTGHYCATKYISEYSSTSTNVPGYYMYIDCSNLSYVRFYGGGTAHNYKIIAIGY